VKHKKTRTCTNEEFGTIGSEVDFSENIDYSERES
jgi:hypothetical protein